VVEWRARNQKTFTALRSLIQSILHCWLWVCYLTLTSTHVSVWAQESRTLEPPAMPSVGEVQVFEALGNNLKHIGNGSSDHSSFLVSSDNRWIVVSDNYNTLSLMHIPSKKVWKYRPKYSPFSICFSSDSRIYIDLMAARIDPDMSQLKFATTSQKPSREACERSLLGENGFKQDPQGQSDREFFFTAHSPDGKTLYEVLDKKGQDIDGIRVSPPSRTYRVDYRRLKKVLADDKYKKLEQISSKVPPLQLEYLRKYIEESLSRPVQLSELRVSPDGHLIAAQAEFKNSNAPIGVLLEMKGGVFIAYPFAAYYYGPAVWSDSQSLYYYAQPGAGTGQGTVHKLILDRSLLR
jgi:hypothetical protein